MVPDPAAASWLGSESRVGGSVEWERAPGIRTPAPSETTCPTCAGRALPACPSCHFLLPPDWRDSTTVTVAMAGARNTGKTIYVGVLVRFLADLVHRHGSALSWGHPRSRQVYHDPYEKALFAATDAMGDERQPSVLEPTPRASTGSYQQFPLIMSLGTLAGRRTHLILRDVAGEDLEQYGGGNALDANLSHFAVADLVVFLFDPLRVAFIASALDGVIPAPRRSGAGDPADVLGTVLSLVGSGRPNLAVVMSKFDAVHQLRKVPGSDLGRVMSSPGAAMTRSPAVDGRYDERDARLLHEEVRGLLQKAEAGQVVRLAERLPHRFLAVSSLGDSPLGERLSPHGIAPYRVLDPLMWILAEKGLVPRV